MGDRATEPRVAPQKLHSDDENLKEMHLKKIKPKPESKPILQSLREGLEQLKKPNPPTPVTSSPSEPARPRSASAGPGPPIGVGLLERISKLRQAGRSRNPAKKSASFTFAVRPEIAMKAAQAQRYSSLEPAEPSPPQQQQQQQRVTAAAATSKQPVQRSVSTSVLEVPVVGAALVELQPDYSRVRDSLAAAAPFPSPGVNCGSVGDDDDDCESGPGCRPADDIYAEICESPRQCPGSHVMARIKILVREEREPRELSAKPADRKYVNSIFVRSGSDPSSGPSFAAAVDDDVIYNTVF